MVDVGHGIFLGRRLDGAQPARPGVHGRPPELVDADPHAGELLDHGRAGDEGEGIGGHDHQVGKSEQQRRPRQSGAGHHHHHRNDARAGGDRPGRAAPSVQRGHAFGHVGPAGGQHHDQGDPKVSAEAAATRMVSPSSMDSAPRRTVDTERTTMAGRPPSSSTPAWTDPVTSRRKIGAAGASRVTGPCYGTDDRRSVAYARCEPSPARVGVADPAVIGPVRRRGRSGRPSVRGRCTGPIGRTRSCRRSVRPVRSLALCRSTRSNCRSTSAHTSGVVRRRAPPRTSGPGPAPRPHGEEDEQHGQLGHEPGDLLIVERSEADGGMGPGELRIERVGSRRCR